MKSKLEPLTESQFHTVWTEAVGEEGYNKSLFRKVLEKLFEKKLIDNSKPKNYERVLNNSDE